MEYTYTLHDLPKAAEKVMEATSSKVLLFYGEMGVGKNDTYKGGSKIIRYKGYDK